MTRVSNPFEFSRAPGRRLPVLVAILSVCIAGLAPLARAQDEHVSSVNQSYSNIASSKRSDLVLLPILAKMDAPPKGVETPEQAAMLPVNADGWVEATAWAQRDNQRAVLTALAQVTKETDWRISYAFGQGYGTQGVPVDLIRARLYTELGDPPTLAAALHMYIPALDRMACLVNVEATRLAAEGKVSDAIDNLINLAFFGRQMCDRVFAEELSWGLHTIAKTQERVRDVAFVDSRDKRACDTTRLLAQIKLLDEEEGYLDFNRIKFPMGEPAAVKQVLARVYSDTGVDGRTFAPTMSRLGSTDHPLRLFSETAKWRLLEADQASAADVRTRSLSVFGNWQKRWSLSWFDRTMNDESEFAKLDRSRYAAIAQSTANLDDVTVLRQVAKVESVGTRHALALLGYAYTNKVLPPTITAIRPAWLARLTPDPFNPNRDKGREPPLEYFVPMRNEPTPHEMNVVTYENFTITLRDDVFVLYSWGSDYARNFARRVENTARRVEAADYLLWPPMMSLYRQHQVDTGTLK